MCYFIVINLHMANDLCIHRKKIYLVMVYDSLNVPLEFSLLLFVEKFCIYFHQEFIVLRFSFLAMFLSGFHHISLVVLLSLPPIYPLSGLPW